MKRIKKGLESIVSSNEDIRNGLPVFKGTRVPVYIVLEHLAQGWSLKDLQEAFPAVKSDQITKLIEVHSDEYKLKHETTR